MNERKEVDVGKGVIVIVAEGARVSVDEVVGESVSGIGVCRIAQALKNNIKNNGMATFFILIPLRVNRIMHNPGQDGH